MEDPKLFEFICKCGTSIEVVGANTEVRCKCKKLMYRADTLHPLELYRYENKLSQAALAKKLGVDRSVVTKIETNCFVISEALRVKIRQLTGLAL